MVARGAGPNAIGKDPTLAKQDDQPDEGALRDRILAFSRQFVQEPEEPTSEVVARRRHWLDAEGRPTRQGRELLQELEKQTGTRSIYRNMP
jgi:hypothetical protein